MSKLTFKGKLPAPKKLKVQLSGEALQEWSTADGTYNLQNTPVNGFPYWKQKFGQYAIWFSDVAGSWEIGYFSHLGSSRCAIGAPYNNDDWPTKIPSNWRFFSDGNWKVDTQNCIQIIDNCSKNTGNYKFKHFLFPSNYSLVTLTEGFFISDNDEYPEYSTETKVKEKKTFKSWFK